MPYRSVPLSTMERIPTYLRVIDALTSHGISHVPSTVLAERAGVSSAQFRKDVSLAGVTGGVRGLGYELNGLRTQLRDVLGSASRVRFVIVGAGNLGRALVASSSFGRGGLDLVGIYDIDQDKVGTTIAGHQVRHDAELEAAISELDVSIAVVTTSEASAQSVAETVVRGGVREILNFAPVVLQVPESVEVRAVDLGLELQMLAFHARRN